MKPTVNKEWIFRGYCQEKHTDHVPRDSLTYKCFQVSLDSMIKIMTEEMIDILGRNEDPII